MTTPTTPEADDDIQASRDHLRELLANGPVGFVLDDRDLINFYSARWQVPVGEIEAALRRIAHNAVMAAYLGVIEQATSSGLGEKDAADHPFLTRRILVNWLLEKAEAERGLSNETGIEEVAVAVERALADGPE